jgi:isoquinoline 1-oxidoreductase beta subunit
MNCFAIESALDEVAVATGQNPLTMRQNLLNTPQGARLLACLNTVASQINASAMPSGNGRGFAVSNGFGSNIAMAIELTPSSVTGTVKILSIFAAVDCGLAVNPLQVETQIQGGIIQGLSAALWGQTTFLNGNASSRNFSNTRVLKMAEVPPISVSIINSGISNLGGIGEIGVPVAAPALANAYYNMTKTRVRNLPIFPNSKLRSLKNHICSR